jgi:amidophosphoribosyltransferase
MGGLFGVVSKEDCVMDVYFGSDYHSHLGTRRGGMAIWDGLSFNRAIHNIENVQFRAKFESELFSLKGNMGIGCISDTEPQPLLVRSHLGLYAVSTVGKANNKDELIEKALSLPNVHFMESNKGSVSMTELASVIIDNEDSFKNGLLKVQELISGSCSLLVLTPDGIYASRDRLGRTPLVIGKKKDTFCVASESCTFANLGYTFHYELGPGEIVLLTPDGMMKIAPPREKKKICAFLWVYYGYPSSTYEGTSVELMRYRNGAVMARNDDVWADIVAGVPDSGTGHAIGYSNESKVPYARPFIKYTPTWSRSLCRRSRKSEPGGQNEADADSRAFSESACFYATIRVVRGTQMRETTICFIKQTRRRCISDPPARDRYECKFLNFSASRSSWTLRAPGDSRNRGKEPETIEQYTDPNTEKYHCMVDCIRKGSI